VVLSSVVFCTEEKVRYDGYSVLRMQINNTNHKDIINIAEKFNLDVWAQNSQEKWMDIMIPPNPEISEIIKQHDHVVHIEDVEEHIQSVEGQSTQNVTRKRQVFFDYYPSYPEIEEWLDVQYDLHPDNSELIVVGRTSQGRDIRGIKIFSNGTPKRAIFIQGGIHAREWITVTTTLYLIQELLSLPSVVETFDFYIVPVLNVDGYIYTRTERLWRKNRQSNSGTNCIGTDMNRNYIYEWANGGSSNNPCSDIYHGSGPESTPEVSGVMKYLSTIPRLSLFIDVHSYGAMWMCPWGFTYNYPPHYDELYLIMEVARSGVRAINGNVYAIGTSANVIYIAAGGSDDSAYGTLNVVPSFTVEITGNSFTLPTSQILPLAREIYNGVLSVSDYLTFQ